MGKSKEDLLYERQKRCMNCRLDYYRIGNLAQSLGEPLNNYFCSQKCVNKFKGMLIDLTGNFNPSRRR